MRIVVDLTRCQSYGQCVFAAPTVFRFHGAAGALGCSRLSRARDQPRCHG
jgi:ferredoxin